MTALMAVLTDAPGWGFLLFALLVALGAEMLPRPRPLMQSFARNP
ncbi:MAG TPA: hypothetical protein VLX85_14580 [Stellaceae bacterium]|nr:hypothetical protein [Stellaceae bacterium]